MFVEMHCRLFRETILTWVLLLNVVIANENNDNVPVTRSALKGHRQNLSHTFLFSYDVEMKTREQNRNNKRMEIESDLIGLSTGYKRAWLLVG